MITEPTTVPRIKFGQNIKKKSIPGHAYRAKRTNPLLVVYFLDCQIRDTNEKISKDGVVAWSISFPGETGDKTEQWIQYVQNITMQQQDLFQNDENEEEDYE